MELCLQPNTEIWQLSVGKSRFPQKEQQVLVQIPLPQHQPGLGHLYLTMCPTVTFIYNKYVLQYIHLKYVIVLVKTIEYGCQGHLLW